MSWDALPEDLKARLTAKHKAAMENWKPAFEQMIADGKFDEFWQPLDEQIQRLRDRGIDPPDDWSIQFLLAFAKRIGVENPEQIDRLEDLIDEILAWDLEQQSLARHNQFIQGERDAGAGETADTPPKADAGETTGTPTTIDTGEQEPENKLPKCVEAAYRSFEYAETEAEVESDREAYNWLKEHGPADYVLPRYYTWVRYVRQGRKHHGSQKNKPRGGRISRSIVTPDDIVQRREDDDE